MSNPEITIYDAETGVTEVREMTAEEYDNYLEIVNNAQTISPDPADA
jgi:hypothetical protein